MLFQRTSRVLSFAASALRQNTAVTQCVRTPSCPSLASRSLATMDRGSDANSKDMNPLFSKLLELFSKHQYIHNGKPRDGKVVDFHHPEELKSLLPLAVSETGCSDAELLDAVEKVLEHSVKTSHPRFVNQLYSATDPYALAGSLTTEVINTNEHTFEAAPVFIMVTKYIIDRLCQLVGYEDGDGIFFPGGSMGNMNAIHLARMKVLEGYKKKGLFNSPRLVMFTSDESHYSIQKGALFMGFGMDSVNVVKTNDRGQMCPNDLRAQIEQAKKQGEVPFFVNITLGSTVLGAFDPIEDIADICEEHKLWLHADGCWGGAAIFSETHKHLVKGIHRTNSFVVSIHKMMSAPVQCVPFVVNSKGALMEANSYNASYLFQPDKFYDVSYDIGDKTVQCGRHCDSLKLWMMWKARGDQGMAQQVDRSMRLARQFADKLKGRDGFELLFDDFQFTNVCFYYIPPSMRGGERTEEWWNKLHQVAPKIKERMTMSGSMMIGFNPIKHKKLVNFFRIIFQNIYTSEDDLDFVVSEIEKLGEDL